MASSDLSSDQSYDSITDVSDGYESEAEYGEVHLEPNMPYQDETQSSTSKKTGTVLGRKY